MNNWLLHGYVVYSLLTHIVLMSLKKDDETTVCGGSCWFFPSFHSYWFSDKLIFTLYISYSFIILFYKAVLLFTPCPLILTPSPLLLTTYSLLLTPYSLPITPFFFTAGVVSAVGKIYAFRPQGPQFDSRLCRDLNICVTFFPA